MVPGVEVVTPRVNDALCPAARLGTLQVTTWPVTTGLPVADALGGRSRDSIRVYNTCAGYQYVRSTTNQSSANWGIGAAKKSAGPYEDLEGFLNRAGELALILLAATHDGVDPKDKRVIRADDKLRPVFGKDSVNMFELAGIVGKHLTP